MGIIDSKNLTVQHFDKFWYREDKKRVVEPLTALYDKKKSKFWGLAYDSIEQQHYMMTCMLDNPAKKTWTLFTKKLSLESGICYEASFNRDRMFIGILKSQVPMLYAISLDDKMEVECEKKMSNHIQTQFDLFSLRRIEGSDTILIGTRNIILGMRYIKETKTFHIIHTFKNVTDGNIESCTLFRSYLLTVSPLNNSLTVCKIPSEITQATMNHTEYPGSFAGENQKIPLDELQEKTQKLQIEFQKLAGFSIDYIGGLLDNLIDSTPKVLVGTEAATVENIKVSNVFSLDLKNPATRIYLDEKTNKLHSSNLETLTQYQLNGRNITPIKGSTVKSSI